MKSAKRRGTYTAAPPIFPESQNFTVIKGLLVVVLGMMRRQFEDSKFQVRRRIGIYLVGMLNG